MGTMGTFLQNFKGVSDIYCPNCNENLMQREAEIYTCFRCGFKTTYRELQEMTRTGTTLKMQRKIHLEPQPSGTVSQAIYVGPETWENLKRKYPENLMHTISALLDGLAANGVVIMVDKDARTLKSMGINNSAQMVTAMETMKMVEAERNQLISTLNMMRGNMEMFQGKV